MKKFPKKIRRFSLLAFFALAILAGAIFFFLEETPGKDFSKLAIKGKVFEIEKAERESEWQKGLSARESLCADCGVLFIFPKKRKTSFWMKDMGFDLDIIWISDGKIVHIERNVSRDSQEIFSPDILADRVLEINSGVSSELGAREGDEVLIF